MLENTKFLLEKENEISIVYLGGSITEGAGASTYSHCWVSLFDSWIKERYKNCTVRSANVGIGGTGSDLGAYRTEQDVLSKKPDLVFFEFAVNDFWTDPETICACTDAILHKIRLSRPLCDIVFLYTTTKTVSECLGCGGSYPSRSVHSFLAYRYGGILQIDVGEVLREKILANGKNYASLLPDTIHPNDEGHSIYFEKVKERFEELLLDTKCPASRVNHPLPDPIQTDFSRLSAHMEDAAQAKTEGFSVRNLSLCGRYPHYIEATLPDSVLTYSFYGRKIDLFAMRAADSGDIVFSVDDLPEETVSTWDKYCLDFDRPALIPLSARLPEGNHTVKIRVSSSHAPESKGTAVRIGAFLII